MLCWEDLPENMKNESVWYYYDILRKKNLSILLKRGGDIVLSLVLLILLSIPMAIISILIKCDSPGEIFFRQTRITQYGRKFRIFKFRTMVKNAQNLGPQVTLKEDMRITRVGRLIRKLRLDELPQLINVFLGEMSFVGTRPEMPVYVSKYTDRMMATLLLPAGVTSLASIKFKDESEILDKFDDTEKAYVEAVLPQKMEFNLEYIEKFNFFYDIKIMFMTVIAVLKK